MAPSLSDHPLPRLRINLDGSKHRMAKADLNSLDEWRAQCGRAVQRCFALAGLSQKEAAGLMSRDQAQIARWCAGTERAQLDALFSVDRLRQPLVIALSELAGADIETVIRVRRLA